MTEQTTATRGARFGDAALRERLRIRMRVPVFAAPMFLVTGPALVTAACRAGIVGAFPTLNARTPDELDLWLAQLNRDTEGAAPYAANLILDRRNPRRDSDLAAILRHQPPMVIASVGAPDPVIAPIHAYGGLVFSDVATLRHARKAAEAGVDGLVLLTAGAGGNTGALNPFAFVAAVRQFWDGPLALAGGLTGGHELRAIQALDVDFAYMGTPFLAARESLAPEAHKQAVVQGSIDDIVLSDRISGMNANLLRPRLIEAGVIAHDGTVRDLRGDTLVSWKNVWSAGHGVGAITEEQPVDQIVADLIRAYEGGN